jgi:hypothetical protein
MLNDILADIVKLIVAGGGFVAIAFAFFKFVGEKWLDKWLTAKFDKEIEQLRLKNNVLMNRTAKLHEWEFEVLPEAWSRLNDAFTTISGLGLRFDQNLDGIPEAQLNEFLSKSPLTSREQTQLKTEANRTAYYARCMDVYFSTPPLPGSRSLAAWRPAAPASRAATLLPRRRAA